MTATERDIRPENLFICLRRCAGPHLPLCGLWQRRQEAEFVAIAPFFPEYRPFVEAAGRSFVVVPADTEHFPGPNGGGLGAAPLTAHTQASDRRTPPTTPPAYDLSRRRTIRALGRAARRGRGRSIGHPIYIIADEPYRELVYGGAEVPFIPNLYDNTIVCYSYSKSLSLPGERIGYICVPDRAAGSQELYAAVAGAARAGGHVCAPSLWQKVIARCAHLRPDLAAYDRNRKALQESLTEMGYRMASPDGAFYLFIQAPNGDNLAFSEMAKKKNLLLVPGTGFDCPGWFRICYCVSYDMIQRSLPVFRELMEACR